MQSLALPGSLSLSLPPSLFRWLHVVGSEFQRKSLTQHVVCIVVCGRSEMEHTYIP